MDNIFVYIFLLFLFYGSICDVLTFEIPNYVSLAAVLLFVPAALWEHFSLIGVLYNFGAGTLVLLVGGGLFFFNVIGAGDVKMLASAAVWAGFPGLPVLLLSVSLVGGVLALTLIVFRRFKLASKWHRVDWLANLHREKDVPYGLAIFLGTVFIFPQLLEPNA